EFEEEDIPERKETEDYPPRVYHNDDASFEPEEAKPESQEAKPESQAEVSSFDNLMDDDDLDFDFDNFFVDHEDSFVEKKDPEITSTTAPTMDSELLTAPELTTPDAELSTTT